MSMLFYSSAAKLITLVQNDLLAGQNEVQITFLSWVRTDVTFTAQPQLQVFKVTNVSMAFNQIEDDDIILQKKNVRDFR